MYTGMMAGTPATNKSYGVETCSQCQVWCLDYSYPAWFLWKAMDMVETVKLRERLYNQYSYWSKKTDSSLGKLTRGKPLKPEKWANEAQ